MYSDSFIQSLMEWEECPFEENRVIKSPQPVNPPYVWILQSKQTLQMRRLCKDLKPQKIVVHKDVEPAQQSLLHYSPDDCVCQYLEEGSIAYTNNSKTRSPLPKRIMKKLFYGYWFSTHTISGCSPWIDEFVGILPSEVRPELRHLPSKNISNTYVRKLDLGWLDPFFEAGGLHPGEYESITALVIVAHSVVANEYKDYKSILNNRIEALISDGHHVGLTYHPSDRDAGFLHDEHLNVTQIPRSVPAELIYLLSDDISVVLGARSSALLTAHWLNPDCQILSVAKQIGFGEDRIDKVYERLGIKVQ